MTLYEAALKALASDFGFSPYGDYYEDYAATRTITFGKSVCAGAFTHIVTIEDFSDRKKSGGLQVSSFIAGSRDCWPLTFEEFEAFKIFMEEFKRG